jgi:two-component system sensor histidine kinase YesM
MNIKWTIKKKILFSISLLIFLSVMIVTVVSLRTYKKELTNLSKEDTKITLQQLSHNIENYLLDYQRLCILPYYNSSLINALSLNATTTKQILDKQRTIENFLSQDILLPHDDIQEVYIFNQDEVYSSKRTQKYKSSSNLSDKLKQQVSSSKYPILVYSENEEFCFSLLCNIYDMDDNSKLLGILRINIDTTGIDNVCRKLIDTKGKSLMIVNNDNKIIYQKSNEFTDEEFINIQSMISKMELSEDNLLLSNKNQYLISNIDISKIDWKIYYISNLEILLSGIKEIEIRSILIGLICSAIGIMVSFGLIKLFLRPIYEITDLMKKVQKEDYNVEAPVKGNDEIAYLSTTFNEMTKKIDNTMKKNISLTKEIYEAKYLEKEAQYISMCNQIKPHFLFNSLNTISLLIKCNKKEEAIGYIEKLATLLNGLVHADSAIKIRSELLVCENYLSMQCIRYTKLSYDIKVDEEIMNIEIPALIIQPIIENSLEHGFARKLDDCKISITNKIEGGSLFIIITDNGCGMDESTLDELKVKLTNQNTNYSKEYSRVALTNISRRIKLKYGVEYGLSVTSEIGVGSKFIIKLPIEDSKNV